MDRRRTWESSDVLAERYAPYAEWFTSGQRVLDLRCGNGEFLQLLSGRGATGLGLDVDESALATITEKGLNAQQGTPHEYLGEHPGEFDGVFAAHLIEHLDATQFVSLVNLAIKALKPRGRLLLVSTNPRNFAMQLDGAWNDLEHVRFYSPEIVRWVVRDAGLKVIDIGENQRYSADPRSRAHVGRLNPALPAAAKRVRLRTRMRRRLTELLTPVSVLERIKATEDVIFYPWAEFYVTGIK
jgi:O-antigen chain-terminating methyltransferase